MDEKMKEALKGIYENLTDEQKEQAKACKSADEFMKLVGEWGIELPDELTDLIAGAGGKWRRDSWYGEMGDPPDFY